MKTSELAGAFLDVWVAKAQGAEDARIEDWGGDLKSLCVTSFNAFERVPYRPSSSWGDGGPIIGRERIGTIPFGTDGQWLGSMPGDVDYCAGADAADGQLGATPLIAAMRAYVASKFGEEVPDA
ncbi:hypothetical protein J2W28_001012 [Variovorax boronicumulans]|uniref:phage protein NinX family protein n=1 Tax=Variovorax boronicumulans TaxID=436515 RepID=UPI002781BADA|nr:phage protein NinX family protein [Variovorax boronicumulans]MDP9991984.1 hypothetical protein [Variovorax boronicumulans]MDQ0001879.1 hypothetical protein [Variovorax boronicumulans]